nr:hypothetical protein [Tanacetum cinerariifolium]
MTPTRGIEVIKELFEHSLSWYNGGNIKADDKELQVVLNQLCNFENNMNIITEEVRMAQHRKGLCSNLLKSAKNGTKPQDKAGSGSNFIK